MGGIPENRRAGRPPVAAVAGEKYGDDSSGINGAINWPRIYQRDYGLVSGISVGALARSQVRGGAEAIPGLTGDTESEG